MAKSMEAKADGMDAALIKPRLIPNQQLLPRDDSGGPDFQPYTQQFGDGGYVTGGDKQHLSARGGSISPNDGSEQKSTVDARNKDAAGKNPGGKMARRKATAEDT